MEVCIFNRLERVLIWQSEKWQNGGIWKVGNSVVVFKVGFTGKVFLSVKGLGVGMGKDLTSVGVIHLPNEFERK